MGSIRAAMRSHMDPFHNSFGWGFVLGGSCAVPVGPQRGSFHWGEGDASSMQGVEVWKCVCVLSHCVWTPRLCVCVAYNDCEQKAQVRDAVWKDMPDLLAALWCMPLLCNPKLLWTNAGLCVCLPRSKNFLDSHPFQRKHYIRPIYIYNAHRQILSLFMFLRVLHLDYFRLTQFGLWLRIMFLIVLMTNLITCLKIVKTSDQLWQSNQRKALHSKS